MKRLIPFLILLLISAGIVAWLLWPRHDSVHQQKSGQTAQAPAPEVVVPGVKLIQTSTATLQAQPGQPRQLLGETILRGYAQPTLPPENDLTLMSHLMENSVLLLKSAANRPLSANGDWADFLRGQNSARERFLPDNHIAFNKEGELVDRWGTPLFFHALGAGRYEIRSAGPDKIMWTDDDIDRDYNGTISHGAELAQNHGLPQKSRAQ
jgi:hypothetical protein